jgi:Transcription initiation factor IIF, alpha subunit (TFIIF-alpha)
LHSDSRFGDELDDMMASSDDESSDGNDDNDDDDGESKKQKKKGKKPVKPKKKRKNASDDEALEDSDDGDGEGRELDYISSSDDDERYPANLEYICHFCNAPALFFNLVISRKKRQRTD